MIGLDTTAIIDLFKGDEGIKKFIKNNKEPFSATILSYAELMFGIKDKKHQEEEEFYDDFFTEVYSFDLTKDACKMASRLHNDLKGKGKETGHFDSLIASIFLSNGVTKVLTRNKKHFERFSSVDVIGY